MSARSGLWPAIVVALLSVAGIAVVQPGLARNVHKLRERDDVFLLPPPKELRALSLGYRSAGADLLWAKLLVEYGMHGHEKRPFPDATRYVDAIIALEPSHATLFEFVDTLLVYTPPPGGTADDARTARRYLEYGMRERPDDAKLWIHAGQFISFIGPAFLKDETEGESWRLDGARVMARGVELGGGSHRALAASTLLGKGGDRTAQIEFLQRTYAISDDPEDRAQVLRKLRTLEVEADSEQAISAVDRALSRYRFLSRGTGLLIGPRRTASHCAGPGSYERHGCARDWQTLIDEDK